MGQLKRTPGKISVNFSMSVIRTVNVTDDGGIVKEVLAEGIPDAFPSPGDEIVGAFVVLSHRVLEGSRLARFHHLPSFPSALHRHAAGWHQV